MFLLFCCAFEAIVVSGGAFAWAIVVDYTIFPALFDAFFERQMFESSFYRIPEISYKIICFLTFFYEFFSGIIYGIFTCVLREVEVFESIVIYR